MMTAWCHGAPGMALARSLAATSLQDASLLADVTAALKTTAAVPVRLDDHLCCGSMGRCDVLLTAGETLRAPAAVEAAWRIALAVVGRAAAEGRYRLTSRGYEFRAFDAGFFRGLSGIGYQLLRLAAPSRLPSILAFELPSTASRS
jgi:lantibiotic modifying enzyme